MKPNRSNDIIKNLTLAGGIISQVGFFTLAITAVALVLGMWVDSVLNTHPLFTIGIMLLSIPVNIFYIVRVALNAMAQIQPAQTEGKKLEDETKEDED